MKMVTRLNVVALLCILALIMSVVAVATSGPQGLQGEPGPVGVQGVSGATGTGGIAGDVGPQGLQGIRGPQGTAGLDGTPGIDGISFIWLGTWSSSKDYVAGEVVGHDGSSYVCILDHTTRREPPSSKYWDLMALAGIEGPVGPAGVVTGFDPGSLWVDPSVVSSVAGGTITVYAVGIVNYYPSIWLIYSAVSYVNLAVAPCGTNRYSATYSFPAGTDPRLVEVAIKDGPYITSPTRVTVPLLIK